MRKLAIPLLAGSLLFATAAMASLRLSSALESRPYDVLHVPRSGGARLAAMGHRTFLSDLYWLESVQYIGEARADARGWDKLFPLVDLVTDLDPRHGYAYQTAGIVLSAVGRIEESDAILEKGVRNGPPYWTFPYYLAFNAWFYRGDYATGARWAEEAARRPGASPNISQLAVSLASKSGTPEDAIALLQELKATVKDEATAGRLDEQMNLAIVERDAQALEQAIARFAAERGQPPNSLRDLVTAGLVPSIPPDPFGGEYVLDPSDGKVHSSANAFRFQLREGPHQPRQLHSSLGSTPAASSAPQRLDFLAPLPSGVSR